MTYQITVSSNPRAAVLMGRRRTSVIVSFSRTGMDYACPVHGLDDTIGEHLQWSEYNGFLWCADCHLDHPSALCVTDPRRATEIFLDSVEDALARATPGLVDAVTDLVGDTAARRAAIPTELRGVHDPLRASSQLREAVKVLGPGATRMFTPHDIELVRAAALALAAHLEHLERVEDAKA